MTLVLESISFFSIEQKLEASRKLLLLQDAAVREKTSLYQKGFYLLLQSFLFSKDPFFFSLLRLLLRLLRAMHALELLISRRGRRPSFLKTLRL